MLSNIKSFLATSVAMNHSEADLTVAPTVVVEAPEVVTEAPIVDFSTQVTRVNTSYNKYDSLIDKTSTLNKKADELSIHEWLFGKDTTDFETRKNNFMARQNRSGYNLKQSASRKSLNTVDGTQWTGPVYMGSQNSSMDVIFDNASDWLVVEGNGCINCEGKTFNIDNSSTAKQVGSSFSQRSYGAASMTGSEWTDLVCVTLQACISDFEFFLISDQQGLKSNVDGVLGLSRNKPFFLSQEKGINRGPSYMLALENA